ncbi:N-acetyl-gamma-glutamyl-phosphate reductase [Opacimonas viscosa]|uniref:N-acetyl-gamma-glutamyl-phosphate reductase n=1 Tax=Opacimonas viscosa TaxID=2961944 RepID=A0AA42BQ88_9ALTE|nr:N-acetyl-gamma-glutamyl-phosphate reductase [Opacimonas viscosa]MCP3429251.1 N-acetyl-gamma-glutamyl-phosphate reductase [Opacimonas viscosa]
MIKTCILGASGYTGAELVKYLSLHDSYNLAGLYVSERSADAHKPINSLHSGLIGINSDPLQPLNDTILEQLAWDYDVIFLATPHEASHDWMQQLAGKRAVVLDLSGAFRIKDADVFATYYGFPHTDDVWREAAIYGLAEWYPAQIAEASLVAVPGCYPTASLTGLKPLKAAGLLTATLPIINAVSGVSGAGRKAALGNSFCEVSLQAYGLLQHRHMPEIEAYLGQEVIFTPHLGNFKRGILATITVEVQPGTTTEQIRSAFTQAYAETPCIRLRDSAPKIDDVVHTPFCDVHFAHCAQKNYVVVTTAIDNVLKGAAAQAIQCANLTQGLPIMSGLVPEGQL